LPTVPLCVGNRAEIGALCKAKYCQAIPPCAPRYRALPTVRRTRQASLPPELLSSHWRHILCASRHAARAGVDQSKGTRIWRRRSWRHPRIQSSARTRQVRPPRWMDMYKFFTAKSTLYKDRDSRAEQYICDCVRYPRWSSSKFAGNFSATICGVICGAFANFTKLNCPLDVPHVAGICENTAPRWRCSYP
jgi:hypothetical protein